jgi:DNA-directed RNA polymerase beta subunit
MIFSTLIQDMNSLLAMNQEDLASFDSYLGEASSRIIYTDVIKMVFRNETPYLSKLNFKTLMSSLHVIEDEDILEAFKENNFNYFFDLHSPKQARPLLKMILEVADRPMMT